MPIFEISGFDTGVSKSGVTFLEPADSFSEIIDGFVFRQELKSRLGIAQFAKKASKGQKPVETLVEEQRAVDNMGDPYDTAAAAAQNFFTDPEIRQSYIIISVPAQNKEIQATYSGTGWVFTGDVNTGGTNTINEDTGEITVTFGVALTSGDPLFVSYQRMCQYIDATNTAEQTLNLEPHIVRNSITITADTDSKEITATSVPNGGLSLASAEYSGFIRPVPLIAEEITFIVNDSVEGVLEILAEYDGATWSFSGDVNLGGTNSIDETTGAFTVTFDETLAGGDEVTVEFIGNDSVIFRGDVDNTETQSVNWNTGEVTVTFDAALTVAPMQVCYSYYPSLRVMGIYEARDNDDNPSLIIYDKEYAYLFDETDNAFYQIPFTSANPIEGFEIVSNDEYVSSASYPDKNNSFRVLFTGRGMGDVYFFDGYGIKRFTLIADNEDYEEFNNGISDVPLTRATHVVFYGERINFVHPVLGGVNFQQGILFSGIRNAGGNGDSFNVSGAGLINLDTSDIITGVEVVNDTFLFGLKRSWWTLDKTKDPFNPYSARELIGTKGNGADFGLVGYDNLGFGIGKLGLVVADLREVKRADNKIPFFTRDDIVGDSMQLTYGVLDEEGSKIYYSYNDDDDLDIQNKVLAYNYDESSWSTYNIKVSVFGFTDAGVNLSMNQIDETVYSSWIAMDTTEESMNKIGLGSNVPKMLAGDNDGFIYEMDRDLDDHGSPIYGITKASLATLTIGEHSFEVDDVVIADFVEGMTEINGIVLTIIDVGLDYIQVNLNTIDYSEYLTGGRVSKAIAFEAKINEFNPFREQGRKCYLKSIEFLIENQGASVEIDVFDDTLEGPYLEGLEIDAVEEGKPKKYTKFLVQNVADFHSIRIRHFSRNTQMTMLSIRLDASPGGITND